ncbi:hypothetical protein OU800_14710 [Pseudomonas sp. GOM7]|uniref:hypothetical protein n=1 Tax=Pseudomonas sp. GOM7 TaxID=2998079 RepID=UPI00227BFCEA|nr:hypothetical protein [Pseudomonas sp. GOM7]WAJ35873.1 hypothetical protein OU800_14710 [Pseudomonas sp. GOM7]
MKTSEILTFLKAEAFLLSAIPMVAIAASFFFEIGYLGFYGVPPNVIEVDLYTVIISCMCLVFLLYVVVEIFYTVINFARKSNKHLTAFCISLIPSLMVLLFAGLYRVSQLLWLALAFFVIFYLYVLDLIKQKGSVEVEAKKDESLILVDKFKGFLFVAILMAGLSLGVGYNVALEKVSYFVVGDDKVLVEIYGDNVVLAYFKASDSGGILTGEIEVVKLSEYTLKGEQQNLGKVRSVKDEERRANVEKVSKL